MPLLIRHAPPLLIATTFTFGGLIPLWNAERAMLEFGLPMRVAMNPSAQSVMIVSSARVTAIGLALWTFYFKGQFTAVDTILTTLGWIGIVDGYVCWKENVPRSALVRSVSGALFAGWGWFGMTSAMAE